MITVPVDLVQKYSPEKPGILILADGRAEKDELYKICGGDQVVTAVGEVGGLGCPSEVSAFISPAFATDDRPCGVIQDDDSERGYAKWPENRSQWPKVIAATAAGGRPCGFEQDMELTVVPSPD